MVDLLSEDAAHHRAPVLERYRRMVCDRLEESLVVVREGRVAVADELADLPPFPAQGQTYGVRSRPALRPGDLPVLEHERRAGRMQRLHGRSHDRLERLLEIERLGDRFGDAGERLELGNPPLRALVQLGVLDCLRHLRRDGDEELDLGVREHARLPGADVERALELGARQNRHGENGLVLVLGQVRKQLEARVEVSLLGNHHGRALGGGNAGDALAGPHPRCPRHLLDAAPVRRAQDELVRALVVQVDEAGVGPERVGDLARNQLEHLLEVERRVDSRNRLGQEAKVSRASRPPSSLLVA